jgi:hypothetical protein
MYIYLLPKQPTRKVVVEDIIEDWRASASKESVIDESSTDKKEVDISGEFLKENILFYWIDAFEDKYNNTGTIYLFGKVKILY